MLIRSQILIVLKCVNRVSLISIYSLTPLHTRMEGELERVTLNHFFLLLTFQAFIWEIHMEAASVQLSFPQHIFWFFSVSSWISDLWTQLCIPATEVIQGPHMATVPVRPHAGIPPSGHLSWAVYDRDILHPEPDTQGLSLCFKAPMSYWNELYAVKGEVQPH